MNKLSNVLKLEFLFLCALFFFTVCVCVCVKMCGGFVWVVVCLSQSAPAGSGALAQG